VNRNTDHKRYDGNVAMRCVDRMHAIKTRV